MLAAISPEELAQRLREEQDFQLIDVRSPAEFAELHVRGARNLPIDQLDPAALAALQPTDRNLYFICHMGGRSSRACEKMIAAGYSSVVNVEGGTEACEVAGLPIVRGSS